MNEDDWKHVETLLNVIELCAKHGTSFTGLAAAAAAELAQIQNPPAAHSEEE